MEKSFWEQRWRAAQIGFHRKDVHEDLIRFESRFLDGGPCRVLVPLCGKSLDLVWLRERGHSVTGVEIVPEAIDAFCAEQGIVAARGPHSGGFAIGIERLTLICADFFALDPEAVGTFDRIWDRAALIAIEPSRREEYAALERRLLGPRGKILLNAFEYDQSRMQGPPWSVPEAQIRTLYGGLDTERIDRKEADRDGRFGDLKPWEHTWLISAG